MPTNYSVASRDNQGTKSRNSNTGETNSTRATEKVALTHFGPREIQFQSKILIETGIDKKENERTTVIIGINTRAKARDPQGRSMCIDHGHMHCKACGSQPYSYMTLLCHHWSLATPESKHSFHPLVCSHLQGNSLSFRVNFLIALDCSWCNPLHT